MVIPLTFKKFLLIIRQSSLIILKLVILDQVTKSLFMNYLRKTPGLTLEITSFLDIVYSWNYGISFGMLHQYYQYSNMFFAAVNSLIIIYLWSVLLRCKTMTGFVGYSFVVGGAVGNLLDRLINGGVFDFIHFHYKDFSFPVFNLADTFICLGVLFLLHDHYKTKKIVEHERKLKYTELAIEKQAERIRQLDFKDNINFKGD